MSVIAKCAVLLALLASCSIVGAGTMAASMAVENQAFQLMLFMGGLFVLFGGMALTVAQAIEWSDAD